MKLRKPDQMAARSKSAKTEPKNAFQLCAVGQVQVLSKGFFEIIKFWKFFPLGWRMAMASIKMVHVVRNMWMGVEVCIPECHFPGTGFFQEKFRKFPVPSIQEHPLPGTISVLPFGSGHFPSRLSPENETGIPEFEILYFNSRNSRY